MDNSLMLILEGVLASGVIWTLVNSLKKVHPIFSTLAPVIAMLVGIAVGLILVTLIGGMSVVDGILAGMLVAGFTSSAYSQKKKMLK